MLCIHNVATGREVEIPQQLSAAEPGGRKVVVIGAGADGLPLILCIIGMFALPELFSLAARPSITDKDTVHGHDIGRLLSGVHTALRRTRTWLRGSCHPRRPAPEFGCS